MKHVEDPGLKLLLLASLFLNLLLFGIVMGHVVRVLDQSLFGQAYRLERMGKLSEESQKKLKTVLEDVRASHMERFTALYAVRDDVETVLAKEPFDRAAFLAHITKAAELKTSMALELAEKAADMAPQLSLQERAVLADIIKLPPRPRARGQSSSKAIPYK